MRASMQIGRAALIASALSLATNAMAQSTDNTAMAEALFRAGRKLVAEGKHSDACPKFAESYRLENKLGTLLNLAMCHESEDKYASAWAEFTSLANLAEREGQTERAEFAHQRVVELQKQLSTVTIRMAPGQPGATVVLDGVTLGEGVLDSPLPVDPGPRSISVTVPGKRTWQTRIVVPKAPAKLDVSVPMLQDEKATVTSVPPTIPDKPRPAKPLAPTSNSTAPVVMWVGFGVGAVGLAVGGIAGAIVLSDTSEYATECRNQVCSPDRQTDLDGTNGIANVSNVGFVVGGLGLATGIVGLVWVMSESGGVSNAASAEPMIGPGSLGIRGRFF